MDKINKIDLTVKRETMVKLVNDYLSAVVALKENIDEPINVTMTDDNGQRIDLILTRRFFIDFLKDQAAGYTDLICG